ncbi:hypothetical protein Rsub_12472 [Raphidocelis subcapitata]|uniref:Fe/B12 periplasmic-binding domain-containing protein n=1 Tax=Raphidocelis subcapitata TaxID=307507 RepID=A0A2V0PNI3_9CHLO|nr:hypothetical protein Rsub_12472 [Raphidocelis subcapitata]|eukprot:GBF99653.1 hypothetical protein Rsub_12472 [Raphidocelis subcapitata]
MVTAFVLGGAAGGAGTSLVAAAVAGALREHGLDARAFTVGAAFTLPPGAERGAGGPGGGGAAAGPSSCASAHGGHGGAPLPQGPACIDLSLTADLDSAVACFHRAAEGADVCVIDGGPAAAGGAAEAAAALGLPLVLVVDAAAAPRGAEAAAALLHGCGGRGGGGPGIAGLVINRAAGEEQAAELRGGLAAAGAPAPVVAVLPQLHAAGGGAPPQLVELAARHAQVDLEQLLRVARGARVPAAAAPLPPPARAFRVAVGVAYDPAFFQYFQQNLSLLAAAGAQLVPFSPLHDAAPPPGVSALLIGGGEPEAWAARLASNGSMLAALRAFASAGGIVLGEGGGLMYLAASMQTAPQQRHAMAGLLPFHAVALPPEQRTAGYVDVAVFGPCPAFAPGARLRGRFQRCCEVLVLEERPVAGLGAPIGPDAAAHAPLRVSDCGSSISYGSATVAYTHCFEARPQQAPGHPAGPAAPAAAGVPEGYTCGSVLGSSIHLFYGSCPGAAGQLVQRCLRVDVAATSAASAQASRVALAAAAASAAAAVCEDGDVVGALRRLPRSGSSSGSDGAQLSPEPTFLSPRGDAGLGWRRPGAKSTPDLLRYSRDAAAGGSGDDDDCGGGSGDVFGYWHPGTRPESPEQQQQQQHQHQHQQHQQLPREQQLPQSAAPPPAGHQSKQADAARQLKSIKSMSIPANMHRLAAEQQQQQQQQQPTVGSLPFSVPKRWSMELQRLGSHLTQHVLQGAGGSAGNLRPADGARGGGAGPRGAPAAGLHRRNASYGSYARLSAALELDLEPLPESAAQAIANHLPTFGRTHAKMIGLACPLGSLSADGGAAALGLPGRGPISGSFGCLSALPAQAQQLHQQQPHPGECGAAGDVSLLPLDRSSERASDGSGAASGSHGAGQFSSDGACTLDAQQQQQQAAQQQPFQHPLLQPLHHPGEGSSSSLSLSRKASSPHADGALPPGTPPMSRAASAHAQWGTGAGAMGAAGPAGGCHRRNSSVVSLPARPARGDTVVSLSPSATATLVALGLGPRLAGVTDACRVATGGGDRGDALPEVVCYAASDGARPPHRRIDADAIRRIRPALVVVPRSDGDDAAPGGPGGPAPGGLGALERAAVQKALERSGVLWPESGAAVLYQRCFTLSEVLEFVSVLAGAGGVPEQGALLCERLRARLRRVAAAVRAAAGAAAPPAPAAPGLPPLAPAPARPLRVAVVCGYEPGGVALAGLWVPEMLQLAGAAPAPGAPSPGEPHARVDWAALQRAAPHVLVLCSPGEGAAGAAVRAGALAALPGWWGLPAVRAGRVYAVDSLLVTDAGVELVEGVELLAHLLAPSAHAPPPAAAAPGSEAPRALRLTLSGGQRCRPRLLPNFFAPLH